MKIEEIYSLYKKQFLVDTDTRNIRKNTLFFALKGDNFNGNEYAEKALELGAKYTIIDESKYKKSDHFILVDDVLTTLQKLANYHRKQLSIPIIGLTGSNGKTTTKELINSVLSEKFKTTATKGNLNNHIGVPLTLLSITLDTEIAIIEMGANHQKEIEFLSSICEPDFGYITNFGKAHLEGFGGIEGVIKGKSELYTYIQKNNKTVFVNPQDALQVDKTKDCTTVFFDTSIKYLEVNPFVKLSYKNTEIQSNLIGKYNYDNIAAAITIGTHFKIKLDKVKNAIESYLPTNNRSQIIKKVGNTIVLDAYNANPTSMKAALENFSLLKENNKTVILGDMFELGESSKIEHQGIVNLVHQLKIDTTFLVGELFYQTETSYKKFKSYIDLENHIKRTPLKHQFILIKGSRGMKLERILSFIN
ncbi:MAG: UDP-N-acetylmuramoyl-tripeptide--D-alanyl-D-alanine ligase [Polaribacter sp.]